MAANVMEIYGSKVFNEHVMKERLPSATYKSLERTLHKGAPLDIEVANVVASVMKRWAMELGATHYTHWFQPLTGITSEKHDGFVSPVGDGTAIMEFSGKELVRGEPDASSFPSGGLRATCEARGYTAWDPTSYAFVKDDVLCIPTAFVSYTGEALDKKTPLLRSMNALSGQAIRILKLFGKDVDYVSTTVGPEQEYFLIKKEDYQKRLDLVLCGRTLFGSRPPKGQELDDHYYGAIKPRVAAFMRELDEELWKLGVLAKTEHNEVAPAQHEIAPIYSDANTACDKNQLTMELLKKVASRHGLVCLLHEKPFAGINGSGKHDNWSLQTDTGENLLKPGGTPSQNAQFLLFLAAFVKGVDEYQELLRCSVAFAGNDHRLGAQEAPPAIISIFLGTELTAILDSIVQGTAYVDITKKKLKIGVDAMPEIPQDTTDRNRTSPLAFTGNKFEFRMLGSSQSISGPNIALNTIMAEELRQFADRLEQAADFDQELHQLVCEVFTNHQRIVFSGNGYGEEWKQEAARRGLSNYPSTAEAMPSYVSPKIIDLVTRHGIFTEAEIRARYAIHLEAYNKMEAIEARTMLDMALHQILPAALHYSRDLCEAVRTKQRIGVSCQAETSLIGKLSGHTDALYATIEKLQKALAEVPENVEQTSVYYHSTVIPIMQEMRKAADALETLTDKRYWPYPTYSDLLFY